MKKLAAAAALLVAGAGALSAPHAQAATTFNLKAGAASPYGTAAQAFKNSKCNTAVIGSPIDGIESKIVDARSFAGRTTRVSWTSTFDLNGATGVSYLFNSYDAACNERVLTGVNAGMRAWNVTVPAGTRWIVVQIDKAADVNVTMS